MNILALDVGTSSVKAAVLDVATATPAGHVARVEYSLDFPTPDAAEVHAERVWQTLCAAARQAAAAGPPVEGVGLSCLMPALVVLDKADEPLLPVWTHLDRRARPAARLIWATVGPEFLQSVGTRPLPGGISAVCFKQQVAQDPYLLLKTKSFLHLSGWLTFRMTGQKAFDRANASVTGLYGTLTDQAWSPRWCDFFEVDRSWLPPVFSGDRTLGQLRPRAAEELGVPAGLPVKLGTADTSCAMLAAGMGPGDLLHIVGSTQVLLTFADRPRPSPRRITRQFGVGDAFVYCTHNPVGGVALDWIRGLCFHDVGEDVFFDQVIPKALGHPTRVTLDPPFLGGDRLEIEACRAAFRDLTLATDRLDLLAAILQAMQRGHREALAHLDTPGPFRRIILTGGGAEVVHKLLPEYAGAKLEMISEESLRGVARLFAPIEETGSPAPV